MFHGNSTQVQCFPLAQRHTCWLQLTESTYGMFLLLCWGLRPLLPGKWCKPVKHPLTKVKNRNSNKLVAIFQSTTKQVIVPLLFTLNVKMYAALMQPCFLLIPFWLFMQQSVTGLTTHFDFLCVNLQHVLLHSLAPPPLCTVGLISRIDFNITNCLFVAFKTNFKGHYYIMPEPLQMMISWSLNKTKTNTGLGMQHLTIFIILFHSLGQCNFF